MARQNTLHSPLPTHHPYKPRQRPRHRHNPYPNLRQPECRRGRGEYDISVDNHLKTAAEAEPIDGCYNRFFTPGTVRKAAEAGGREGALLAGGVAFVPFYFTDSPVSTGIGQR